MKRKSFVFKRTGLIMCLSFMTLGAVAVSCDNNLDTPITVEEAQASNLSVSISPVTKASGAMHGVQADDNVVQSVEIFVFKNEGSDAGVLDAYKKFSSSELTSLDNLQLRTTVGAKKIYAVANSHKENWTDINTLSQFESVLSLLQKENVKDFAMVGCTESVLAVESSVTIDISRLVARVHLSGISTNFAGTPYEGYELENVKAYLINVVGDITYAEGEAAANPIVLNAGGAVSDDISGCTMTGMLYDELGESIGDTGYSTSHYFYCYENMVEDESSDLKFTKLVIQADLNGTTYYYPININREGYGYVDSNGHTGVKRNTSYSLNIVISRPGSLDPNVMIETGTLTTILNVMDWETIPVVDVEF